MPADAQTQQLLDAINAAADPSAERTVEASREAYRALSSIAGQGPDVAVAERCIAGPAGEIPLRIYTPHGQGPFGVLVFLHGGGWTIGDLDTHDHPCRTLCADAGVVVVSVDYRLAPEHPFPAALDDAWAALTWVGEHAGEVGGDPGRLAVGGDSAGGNLAAVCAIRARDEGGPPLRFQLLVYPGIDARPEAADDYPSRRENAEGYVLTLDTMEWFQSNYVPDPEDRAEWRVSPIAADDLSGLPPALVITCELDPLRDEGTAYAEAMRSAGVEVTHSPYAGTVHTMYQLAPILDAVARARAESAAALREAIGGS